MAIRTVFATEKGLIMLLERQRKGYKTREEYIASLTMYFYNGSEVKANKRYYSLEECLNLI